MFEEVVVAVGGDDFGRDAVAIGKELGSAHGRLTLAHVLVVASKPAPDSGAVGDAGDAADELARCSDSVDLLVVGAHKYRPLDHLLDGSTSQRLAGRAFSPLRVLPSAR